MTGTINFTKLKWNDGWGAVGFGTVLASAAASKRQHVLNKSNHQKQLRWQKFQSAVDLKRAVDQKTIPKKVGADMCCEIGVDPQFLDNKSFKEISSDSKSVPSDSSTPPMASISFSNYRKKNTTHFWDDTKDNLSTRNSSECGDCHDVQSQKPREYVQVAEVAVPNNYGISTSIAEQRSVSLIWGLVFMTSASLYLIVLNKLKNTAWYHKNFESDQSREDRYQRNFDRSYEKIEKLEENQKKSLENQNKILELLKKNEFIKKQ